MADLLSGNNLLYCLLHGNDKVMTMAQSTAERQRKHRRKVKGSVVRIDLEIPVEVAAKLGYLAHHWCCTRREALSRLLMETWQREDRPIPGYDEEGNPLPDNNTAS